jgi:hypothetical protein
MGMRRSYTAVVERGEPLSGDFVTEPYEAGWATEAVVFVRLIDARTDVALSARIQISPDGLHWIDEGTALPPLVGGMAFARVREFGNWLRLAGAVGPTGTSARALVYFVLKE